MRRRAAAGFLAAIAAACGGSGSSPAVSPPASVSAEPSKVARLEATTFDALVLSPARPSLVEFHSPT
jgi:hypothetical protein